jgi:hypothetical protein
MCGLLAVAVERGSQRLDNDALFKDRDGELPVE